jgi:hypothetical protein
MALHLKKMGSHTPEKVSTVPPTTRGRVREHDACARVECMMQGLQRFVSLQWQLSSGEPERPL